MSQEVIGVVITNPQQPIQAVELPGTGEVGFAELKDVGPQGLSGYSGFSGLGLSGYSGSGISGYSGASGLSGYSSASGYSGASGISGYSGSGISGYSGFSGIGTSGFSGYSGIGTSGFSGSSGISGYSGSGVSGYSGFSGSGISGYSGSGISGYSGYSGAGLSGFSGFSSTSGFSGQSGYSGFSGSGVSGYSGSGISGYSGAGLSGYSGFSSTSGFSGKSGYSGSGVSGYSGFSGNFGANSQSYVFDTNTTDSDPGSGRLKFSDTILANATQMYVNNNNAFGSDIQAWIDNYLSGIITVFGSTTSIFTIFKEGDPSIYANFQTSTADIDGTGYRKIDGISLIASNGTFLNDDPIILTAYFVSSSNGISGYSGSGVSGYSGAGLSGFSGYSSTSGYSGYSSLSGFSGYSGSGVSGYSGAGTSGYSGFSGQGGITASLWQYRTDTGSITGNPASGRYQYDNATQTSAANLYFNSTTSDGFDITIFLNQLISGQDLYIQDANNAANFQKWIVNGSISNPSAGVYQVPVGLITSGGTGTTNFPDNHQMFIAVLRIGASGYSGFSGKSGYSGYSGSGLSGYSGFSGTGTSGFSGFSGVGTSGFSGFSGATGGTAGRAYYPENSVSSDLSGYKVASRNPSPNVESDIVTTAPTSGLPTLAGSFATIAGEPNITSLPSGTAYRYIYASTSTGSVQIRTDLFRYKNTGNEATTGAISLTYSAAAKTIVRGSGDFTADGFTQGAKITVSGTVSNNGTFTIQTVVALTITLIQTDTLVNETATSTVTTKERRLRTGNTSTFSDASLTLQVITYTDANSYTFASDDRIIFKWWVIRISGTNPSVTIATEGTTDQSYIITTISLAAVGTSGYSGYSGYSGSGVSGYSGFSGSGLSGYSGFSGVGTSGYSGYSGAGTSGYSGFSAATPGASGYSGFSGGGGASGFSGYSGAGLSGYSGYSGISAYSGYSGAGIAWTELDVITNDFTTTSTTLVNVTGLVSGTLTNAAMYEFEMVLWGISSSSAGVAVALTNGGTGTGMDVKGVGQAFDSGSVVNIPLNTDNTASASFWTGGAVTGGSAVIKGFFFTKSTGTASIAVTIKKITSGTATVKKGSLLRYRPAVIA